MVNMKYFKVGQRFTTDYNPSAYQDCVFEIIAVSEGSSHPYSAKIVKTGRGSACLGYGGNWKNEGDMKIINNKNYMNIKEKFITAFLKEPEKSFRKVGITNGDGYLTEDGEQVFLGWVLKKFGAEFKTDVVDDLIKEQKEENE